MKEKIEIIASHRGYQVTDEGQVIGARGEPLSKVTITSHGYHYFSLRVNGKSPRLYTHRLQAYQKYGSKLYEEGIEVRHLDGNRLNNSWDNILIGTHSENMMDIPQQIRIKRAKYASSHIIKYNKKEVIAFYIGCKSYKDTMQEFNISSKGTLHYILKGRGN